MIRAFGEVLPLAVGIAISPLAVIVVIVMLLSARGRANGWAFVAGWTIGVVAITAAALALAEGADASTEADTRDGINLVRLVLGVLFVALAIVTWRRRPSSGAPATEPRYMALVESFGLVRALGAGAAIATVLAPKNIALEVVAGTTIAEQGLSAGADATVVVLFAIVSAASLIAPLVAASIAAGQAPAALAAARQWLVANDTAMMLVMFTVLAAVNIGRGLRLTG